MKKFLLIALTFIALSSGAVAQVVEPIKFGDFETWTSRKIYESGIIGGQERMVYVIGPENFMKYDLKNENSLVDNYLSVGPYTYAKSNKKKLVKEKQWNLMCGCFSFCFIERERVLLYNNN